MEADNAIIPCRKCGAKNSAAQDRLHDRQLCGRCHAPFVPGQGNNVYIFPGVGLGIIACEAKRITDRMFLASAKSLAAQVLESDLTQGRIFPSLKRIQEVSAVIATAVAEVAYSQGLARKKKPVDLLEHIKSRMYQPVYQKYV
jgi:malate dehydrogenase (oxaloacetate-decarboxylating)(NADP+)